jgi:putative ATP-binding cassette transporter
MIITLLGFVSGLIGTAFLALITMALRGSRYSRYYLLSLFIGLAALRLLSVASSQFMLIRFTQDSMLRLCETMTRRILHTPFRSLEQIGTARILATLTDDVLVLAYSIQIIPTLASQIAVLVGCALYLAYTSWIASLVMIVLTTVGALCYKILMMRAHAAIEAAQAGRDKLFGHFRSLTDGIKELKMSSSRQQAFLRDEIGETVREVRKQNLAAARDDLIADSWSQGMFYLLLGLLLFVVPVLCHLSSQQITTFAFAALYAMAPVWGIMSALPVFHRGQVALQRIESLGISLDSEDPELSITESVSQSPDTGKAHSISTSAAPVVELDKVVFSYGPLDNVHETFVLGPISLVLEPEQLIFIVGGNGSGKSTLVKLITGLYPPDSGEIRVNGRPVKSDRQSYRQLFSTVYSDFYIFDRLLGIEDPDLDGQAKQYLERLHLEKKVSIKNGRFSTIALSQGQRRRLALLGAYLENRQIYVFDEWAADQDPAYKEIFYTHLLPELKRRGKIVVVITHDDRFFGMGDKVIELNYGTIQRTDSEVHVDSTATQRGASIL